MSRTRINPETGILEESTMLGWSPVRNDQGNMERTNPESGLREESTMLGWTPSRNDDGRMERIDPETGLHEEKTMLGWSASRNDEGHLERINPDTGLREEHTLLGWQALRNDEGRMERINTETGDHEEKEALGWAPKRGGQSGSTGKPAGQDEPEASDYPDTGSGYSSSSRGSTGGSKSRGSGEPGWITMTLVIGFVLYAVLRPKNEAITLPTPLTHASHQQPAPPAEMTVKGGLPFEGAQLGKWVSKERVPMYDSPRGPQNGFIPPGYTIQALSCEITTHPRKAVVTRTYTSDEANGVHVGDTVYELHPLGEGAVAVWAHGKVVHGLTDLTLDYGQPVEALPHEWTWWVQVRMENGIRAWVKNPQGQFSGVGKYE